MSNLNKFFVGFIIYLVPFQQRRQVAGENNSPEKKRRPWKIKNILRAGCSVKGIFPARENIYCLVSDLSCSLEERELQLRHSPGIKKWFSHRSSQLNF